MELNSVHHTDLLTLCSQLEPASVDMILCDLPYGTTQCAWDEVIPFQPMWEAFRRVVKPSAAIVLTASQPFTSALVMSNVKLFRYSWVWKKSRPSGFLDANRRPMNNIEDVVVFFDKLGIYNPQKTIGDPIHSEGKKNSKKAGIYADYELQLSPVTTEKYPGRVLEFKSLNPATIIHPTQKPVPLFEYLIRTYTNEGALIFDPCAGSGTTAIAALQTNRNFIVGDTSLEYVDIMRTRVQQVTLPLFKD